jgi:hypothetical protein
MTFDDSNDYDPDPPPIVKDEKGKLHLKRHDLALRDEYIEKLQEILESILECDLCDGCATAAKILLENDPRPAR